MVLPSAGVAAAAESYSGKGVAPPAQGHHFLHIDDFSTDELRAMLANAAKVSQYHLRAQFVRHVRAERHSKHGVNAPATSAHLCLQVKEKFRQRDESFKPFAGKTMAMIFTKPSMRTRISFETVRFCNWERCRLGLHICFLH
jgi:ornithine carbamoyltransferase